MRWDTLFDDLQAQLEREETAESAAVRAEEERQRRSRLRLGGRFESLLRDRTPVRLRLCTGDQLVGVLRGRGADWVSGELDGSAPSLTFLVPHGAIASVAVEPLAAVRSSAVGSEPNDVAERFVFALVLRDLARRRAPVEIVTTAGRFTGTIDLVGADHLDIAVHDRAVARRGDAVTSVAIVPLASIVLVIC
jgi:hypothetical protein